MRRPATVSVSMMAALLVAGAGCQSPTAPGDDPAPRPTPALRHNALVELRRIDVEGACDGKDLLGNPRKGDFAYRVRVRENPIAGTPATHILESTDYGSALGQVYLRGPGQSIDLNDRSYLIRGLAERESVTISLEGIEWDVVVRDSRMDGKSASQTRSYARDGKVFYELNLGSGDCKIELEYAIDWSTP